MQAQLSMDTALEAALPLCLAQYEISNVKQQESMRGIKKVEKVFHAIAFFIVVAHHKWQRRYHHPLCGNSELTPDYLIAELRNTEYDVRDAEQVLFLLEEVHQHAQRDKFKAVFIEIKVWNHAGYRIAAEARHKGKNNM